MLPTIERYETHVTRHSNAAHATLSHIKELSAFVIAHIETLSADEVAKLHGIVMGIDRQLDNMAEAMTDIQGDLVELNKYYAASLSEGNGACRK